MEKKQDEFKKGIDFNTIHYVPHIKGIGFSPSPVAGNIPKWADSYNYPKVRGTPAWNEFWEEQLNYCLNGYDTGGVHISGRPLALYDLVGRQRQDRGVLPCCVSSNGSAW